MNCCISIFFIEDGPFNQPGGGTEMFESALQIHDEQDKPNVVRTVNTETSHDLM